MDVSLIRAGSLHRANGGYLVLEATNLFEYPYGPVPARGAKSRQIKMSSALSNADTDRWYQPSQTD